MFGMSGAGKSVNMIDLLSQTEPYYDYTVIVEEGLSYGNYTQTVADDAKPIIIQPNGTLTFNYLDSGDLPPDVSPDRQRHRTVPTDGRRLPGRGQEPLARRKAIRSNSPALPRLLRGLETQAPRAEPPPRTPNRRPPAMDDRETSSWCHHARRLRRFPRPR